MILAGDVPDSLVTAFAALGFERDVRWERHNPPLQGRHTRFRSGHVVLDILFATDPHHASAFRRRRKKLHRGMYIWFPSPEDLVMPKLRAGRHGDLEDVVGIFERVGNKLDPRYLGRWARRLRLTDELNYLIDRG
jgi:hypothetical protein